MIDDTPIGLDDVVTIGEGRQPLYQVVGVQDMWAWVRPWPFSANYSRPLTVHGSTLRLVIPFSKQRQS